MENEFDEVMAKQTDAGLIKILNSPPGDYQPSALAAAKREFDKRNLSEAQVIAVKQDNELQQQLEIIKANEPLDAFWKFLSFIFPGVIPLFVAGIFKADGYDRKTREVVRWTIFGFSFYFGLAILSMILRKIF